MSSKQPPEIFSYFDLWQGNLSKDIDALFPNWQRRNERILVISPHDDDAVIGTGYLILAALANQAGVSILIICDGRYGYSSREDKETIIERRREETILAYQDLGVEEDHIHRLDYPDFSAWSFLGWHHPGGLTGSTAQLLPLIRSIAPTRLVLPNPYREHQDHEAAFRMGAYDGPQVGDSILAEIGIVEPVRSYLQYSVWADFDPMLALAQNIPAEIRANRAILAPEMVENQLAGSIRRFASQKQVIQKLLEDRSNQRIRAGMGIELYLSFDPRPKMDYTPYHNRISEILRGPISLELENKIHE
jgi:LmbE family N-acetylglucosaminyl deacetylase